MKKTLAFIILMVSLSSFAESQIILVSNDTTRVRIRNSDLNLDDHQLLYVLKSEDQSQEVLVSKSQDIFKYIEPSDIQSISVYKGESAISKFGSKAEYGAVVILFKKDKFERLQKDLNDKLIDGK
jgi:hypothetical protein